MKNRNHISIMIRPEVVGTLVWNKENCVFLKEKKMVVSLTLIVARSETRTRRAVIAPITRSLKRSTFNKTFIHYSL